MLAYVFWHWRKESVDREEYEHDLSHFHRTLASNKPAGFISSTVFSLSGADWLSAPAIAYEEWYLLKDSAAMDPLNYAAVHDACTEPHNRVAMKAAGGTGGLYRLRQGDDKLSGATHATWLNKPEVVSYPDFYQSLEPVTNQKGVALWGRQMTLGPTTEFCIHSQEGTVIQTPCPGKTYQLALVWTDD
jgi:hypothetical protein